MGSSQTIAVMYRRKHIWGVMKWYFLDSHTIFMFEELQKLVVDVASDPQQNDYTLKYYQSKQSWIFQ